MANISGAASLLERKAKPPAVVNTATNRAPPKRAIRPRPKVLSVRTWPRPPSPFESEVLACLCQSLKKFAHAFGVPLSVARSLTCAPSPRARLCCIIARRRQNRMSHVVHFGSHAKLGVAKKATKGARCDEGSIDNSTRNRLPASVIASSPAADWMRPRAFSFSRASRVTRPVGMWDGV